MLHLSRRYLARRFERRFVPHRVTAPINPLILLAAISFLAGAGTARADGMFVWKNRDIDIAEPEQKAVLVCTNGWEDLILEVRYEGAASQFGWIVPLPSKPEMSPAKSRLFEELSRRTQERRIGMSRWRWKATRGGLGTGGGVVDVLEQRRVGIYDTTVLTGRNGSALRAWLAEHSFALPEGADEVLDEYVRKNWVFVAMTIAPEEADWKTSGRLASGTIQPIRFRFATPEAVFPLRISSVHGRASDVLLYVLADDHYINRTCRRVEWETRLCGPHARLSYIDPQRTHSAEDDRTFFISKLRAHVEPDRMEDVFFSRYDPVPDLQSSDPVVRTEAASCLGWSRAKSGVSALVQFLMPRRTGLRFRMGRGLGLWSSETKGQDVQSALWALGEIGDAEAVPCLLEWAREAPPECRLEALNSLAALRSPGALSLFTAHVFSRPGGLDQVERAMRDLSFEALVTFGDSTCLAGMRRRSPGLASDGSWASSEDRTLGIMALAACGDDEAASTIVESIVAESGVTASERLLEAAERGGSVNGFPAGVWIGEALIVPPLPYCSEWPSLSSTVRFLQNRPRVLDGLLRRASSDLRVPSGGRVLLLGCLTRPAAPDRTSLDHLWSLALQSPLYARVPVLIYGHEELKEDFNLPACEVIYAWARWKDADALRRAWARCPAEDRVLRSEVAFGLARCGRPEDLDILSKYVCDDWNAMAARFDFGQLLSGLERHADTNPFLARMCLVDAEYRAQELDRNFTSPAGTLYMERMIRDEDLHPAIRLHWIGMGCGQISASDSLKATCLVALRNIETHLKPGDPLSPFIPGLRKALEWKASQRSPYVE